jgi:hypothetical protein
VGALDLTDNPSPNTKETEIFQSIRSLSYSVTLPPLNTRHVAELVVSILGPRHRFFLTKQTISRIYARTQGSPGLVVALTQALLTELEHGRTPSIENVRTPGSSLLGNSHDCLQVYTNQLW